MNETYHAALVEVMLIIKNDYNLTIYLVNKNNNKNICLKMTGQEVPILVYVTTSHLSVLYHYITKHHIIVA